MISVDLGLAEQYLSKAVTLGNGNVVGSLGYLLAKQAVKKNKKQIVSSTVCTCDLFYPSAANHFHRVHADLLAADLLADQASSPGICGHGLLPAALPRRGAIQHL